MEEKLFIKLFENLEALFADKSQNPFGFSVSRKQLTINTNGRRWLWIADRAKEIGVLAAHYEVNFRNNKLHVELHFEKEKGKAAPTISAAVRKQIDPLPAGLV